ncbi:hypothetical protein E0198_001273 [Clavispora lusitaniae]|nr:hypothetical protein E0198_001273 [Clavispora lusitaniae]
MHQAARMAHDHAEPQASCSKTSSLLLQPAASISSTSACPAQTHRRGRFELQDKARAPSYLVSPFISRPALYISACRHMQHGECASAPGAGAIFVRFASPTQCTIPR